MRRSTLGLLLGTLLTAITACTSPVPGTLANSESNTEIKVTQGSNPSQPASPSPTHPRQLERNLLEYILEGASSNSPDQTRALNTTIALLIHSTGISDAAVAYDGAGTLQVRSSSTQRAVDAAIVGTYTLAWRPVVKANPIATSACPTSTDTQQCDLRGRYTYRLQPAPFALSGTAVTQQVTARGESVISLAFDATTAQHVREWTTRHVGEQVALSDNTRVVTAPTIQTAITGGSLQISGPTTTDERDEQAARLTLASMNLQITAKR